MTEPDVKLVPLNGFRGCSKEQMREVEQVVKDVFARAAAKRELESEIEHLSTEEILALAASLKERREVGL